jgi:hypothetical protein
MTIGDERLSEHRSVEPRVVFHEERLEPPPLCATGSTPSPGVTGAADATWSGCSHISAVSSLPPVSVAASAGPVAAQARRG